MPVTDVALRRRAHPLADQRGRVAVAPRQQADGVHGVGTGEGGVAGAGVLGGAPQRLDDEVDRLEHLGPPVDAVAQLTGTDEDWRTGVDQWLLQRAT